MKFLSNIIIVALVLLTFNACKKDDPVIPHEEEVITTLNYVLTPQGGGETVMLAFQDLDGDGGNAPTYSVGKLAANTTYTGVVALLNEAEEPAEVITEEVLEEGAEHQMFYVVTNDLATISYADTDEDGKPIGIATTFVTGDAGTGKLTIVLRHEPNKTAEGVEGGDITNAGGETDIEVTFDIEVE